jgi:hypothetical protein
MKDRSTHYLACAALGTLALATAPAPQAHDNDAHAQAATTQQLNSQRNRNDLVKIVKQVTDKYHSIAMAENDDYHLLFGCVSDEDSGAMGLHFVKLSLYLKDPQKGIFDDQIDPYQPEIILYEPTPWGPKLTGADYIVDAATWNKTHSQAPELDGQIFHFFDAPNRFGLPPFYTLHVWAWKDSPTGTFVNWNKDVRCDAHNGPNK